MRFRFLPLLVAAALVLPCFLSSPARAQVAGSLVGHVYDQNGQPLRGVKISATSETQIGGAKVAYTNDEGFFRIPGLLPGVFEASATAPKMQKVVQRNITVGITTPAEVDLLMNVEAAAEEVQIVETTPTLSTTAPNVKESYNLEFVAALPIDGLVTKVEPFVGSNTPGAGAGGDRYRGGTNRQNMFMVEGFSMGNQRYTMKSLATIDAQTAAYGAENAASQGAVVNMVTKSGSNKFEFDVLGFYEDNRLAPFQEPADRAAPTSRVGINPAFSGPIIKDKLWFFVTLELRRESKAYAPNPAGLSPQLPTEPVYIGRGSFKLSWQISPRHKLSSFTMFNREAWSNVTNGNYDREFTTAWNTPRLSAFTGLSWEALLTDSLFLRSQVAVQDDSDQYLPEICNDNPDCWNLRPIEQRSPRTLLLQNYEQIQYNQNQMLELVNTLQWFKSGTRFGDHDVKLVSRFTVRKELTYQGVPGDQKLILNGNTPFSQVDYFSNDPRFEEAHRGYFIRAASGRLMVNSISDSLRVTRHLSLNAGLALVSALGETNAGRGSIDLHAVTPHLSMVWDATHDGRTAIRGSFANYVDADAVRVSRYALGNQVSRECQWDEASQSFNRNCQYAGGANSVTFGLPCGPKGTDATGKGCQQEIQLPRMWEYTLGAEREILPGMSLASDMVYRVFTRPYELIETNRIWNNAGTNLDASGSYRNGRAEQIQDLETSDEAQRRYFGVTTVVRKREGPFKVQMGYTWSRVEGNVDNSGDSPFGDIGPRNVYLWGDLQDDRRHDIRGSAAWQATPWLSLGTTYSYSSGAPYSRTFRNTATGRSEDYRARLGMNPSSNINDPSDDRSLRLPDLQRLNIKVQANLKPLFGIALEPYVDLLNILNLRATTAVVTEDGATFGAPRTLQNPMLLRLGARYRY